MLPGRNGLVSFVAEDADLIGEQDKRGEQISNEIAQRQDGETSQVADLS